MAEADLLLLKVGGISLIGLSSMLFGIYET